MTESAMREESRSDSGEKLLALARKNGPKGVREREAADFLPSEGEEIQALGQRLEAQGKLRILSFSPLFAVSPEAVDFLGQKLVQYITAFHEKHPKEDGVTLERLKNRFDVPGKVLLLALKTLVHEKRLRQTGAVFALASHERRLPVREERLLSRLEGILFMRVFRVASLKDVQDELSVPLGKLEVLLDILVERKRIVRSNEGFVLHSRRLEEIEAGIRALGKKELSVADFKAVTGLSRKFLIPLLELLDDAGLTRRTGPTRDILERKTSPASPKLPE
jgi:selenocysteine-specific elongation factor